MSEKQSYNKMHWIILINFRNIDLIEKLSRISNERYIIPSEYFGVLIRTRFDTRVENPGAKQDWAIKPSLSSFKQTA